MEKGKEVRNEALVLRGVFQGAPNTRKGGDRSKIPDALSYNVEHLSDLVQQIRQVHAHWEKHDCIGGVLFSVHYKGFAGKSNRVKAFLGLTDEKADATVRGSRFAVKDHRPQSYIFTHFMNWKDFFSAEGQLGEVLKAFSGYAKVNQTGITREALKDVAVILAKKCGMPLSCATDLLREAAYIDRIAMDRPVQKKEAEAQLTCFYETDVPLDQILAQYRVNPAPDDYLDSHAVLLKPHDRARIEADLGSLIAMSVSDLSVAAPDGLADAGSTPALSIPEPADEPVIGVIDTLFNRNVYFSRWVDVRNDAELEKDATAGECKHGTEVTSVIVDGPRANPGLDDHCGRFRVRHFGVMKGGSRGSVLGLLKNIERIVADNPDIVVWNLSLGSTDETEEDQISAAASKLDELQYRCNVVFVMAATNGTNGTNEQRIGSPADSVNAITVGAADRRKAPTNYTRRGPVLSFFTKPDVICFGGTAADPVCVCGGQSVGTTAGNSFAAPWIARKLAYLIHTLQLPRETAKALIVDSAVGWHEKFLGPEWPLIGYGNVPVDVYDIVTVPADEIRFVLHARTCGDQTFHYGIPIPADKNGKFNFSARATMCYFPECSRNQGVDYTLTDLGIKFGPVGADGKSIHDIRLKSGEDPRFQYIGEKTARAEFQKWANVKVLKKEILRAQKRHNPNWGISLEMNDRLGRYSRRGMPFSVVVTLKEKNGVNCCADFIKACHVGGWIVDSVLSVVKTQLAVNLQGSVDLT